MYLPVLFIPKNDIPLLYNKKKKKKKAQQVDTFVGGKNFKAHEF